MDYQEALKKIQVKKVKENFLLITFSYDLKLVLPYKDGVAFLNALANAEQLHDPYQKQHNIAELDRSKIAISPMSHEEYERYKIAALLNISVEEVKNFSNHTN